MSDRFSDLKKVPREPAMRLLALANLKLSTPLGTPANAAVSDVMAFLEAHEEKVDGVLDMIRLMAASLPPRERSWWACLAARDMLSPESNGVPETLAAAEAWVRKPSDETRTMVRDKLEVAEPDDPTTLASVTAVFCDGKLGAGDLAQYDAPAGASQGAAFGMNVSALEIVGDGFLDGANHLVDRALDLARGGNGKPQPLLSFRPEPLPEDEDEDEDELETEAAS